MPINKQVIDFPQYSVERDWLFAPSTYLVDSFEPFVEEIYLPEVATKPGRLKFELKTNAKAFFFQKQTKLRKIKNIFLNKKTSLNLDNVFIDLRQHYPSNLAHAITIHLPLALCAQQYLKTLSIKEMVLIFPAALPNHIKDLFRIIGFEIICTDSVIEGQQCTYELDSLICIRGSLPEIIRTTLSETDLPSKLLQAHNELPKKIFISRKDTRKLINENVVDEFLIENGYEKIYMEDYSMLQQLAIVSLADKIVAIHGAALGPLIFRDLFDRKPLELVEIFSPAHMTNVYRIVIKQINGRWVGVRGKVWPKLIKQAYECDDSKVRQYSLENFEICLLSLDKALNADVQ